MLKDKIQKLEHVNQNFIQIVLNTANVIYAFGAEKR